MHGCQHSAPVLTDALVIGAGPVGLFQAFQLGLQGIRCHIVDALPHVGGQCIELYADKPIYDIPAITVCTGRELVQRLQAQIAPFQPEVHLNQRVAQLQSVEGGWRVSTEPTQDNSGSNTWVAKTVFIAAGVGAFVPRSLSIEGLEPLLQRQVWFASQALPPMRHQHVVVAGENDAALQTCLDAVADAAHVSLIHRREKFDAEASRLAAFQAALASGHIRFVAGQVTGLRMDEHNSRMGALTYLDAQGQSQELTCDHLVMALGLSPKLGPVAQWDLQMQRKQLVVNTETFATSAPGIFAVGDINTYPGKKKLILCGFHEATLAAFGAAAHIWPEDKTLLQYTTTSTLLQQRLGVL